MFPAGTTPRAVTRSKRGFTLIETMVTLLITAMVMSLVYASVRGTGRALGNSSVRNELYRSVYALLEEMGKELNSAYLSQHGHPLNGRAPTYFYVENQEIQETQAAKLYFTTFGHGLSPTALGESDQSEICYSAQYSRKRQELVLLKIEDTTPDELTCRDEDWLDWDRPYAELPTPVATGIHPEKGTGFRLVGFEVSCNRTLDEDEEPQTTWDSQEVRTIPSRVRVTLTFADDQGNLFPFSKLVQPRLQLLGNQVPGT